MTAKALAILRWVSTAVAVGILAGFARQSATEGNTPRAVVFALIAIVPIGFQVAWSWGRTGRRGHQEEAHPVADRQGARSPSADDSLVSRLNEFGWNALPAYLVALGALFLLYGVATGDLPAAGIGALFVVLSIWRRRQEGAWFRRL